MSNANRKHPIIAIDATSGDLGLKATIPAALMALKNYDHLTIILVGDPKQIETELKASVHKNESRCFIQPVIGEKLAFKDLHHTANAAIHTALTLVQQKKVNACITSRTTQSFLEMANILNKLPNIQAPALSMIVPSLRLHHQVCLLDLGANVNPHKGHLLQYAMIGSIFSQGIEKIASPKIGLLNIEAPLTQNHTLLCQADHLLSKKANQINYKGFIQLDDILEGNVDVAILSGSTGHIALQLIESGFQSARTYAYQSISQSGLPRLASSMIKPFLNKIEAQLNISYYSGTSLVGYDGVLIKAHTKANQDAFYYAIQKAITEVEEAISERIIQKAEHFLN